LTELNKTLHISRRFGYHAPEFSTTRGGTLTIKEENHMGKGENKRKETKKKPAKTMAEKKAAKREKGK
jgi:hypothetical protein